MEYLLAQGADVDGKDKGGMTALHYAACRGDQDNLKFLLDSGADVNSKSNLLGTPVCVAAFMGHAEAVEILLGCAASLKEPCRILGSAIHCACFGGNASIVESMLNRGESMAHLETISVTAFSKLSDSHLDPLKMRQLLCMDFEKLFAEPHIKCSPTLLAAERGHFALLSVFWSSSLIRRISERSYCSPDDTWELRDETETEARPWFKADSGSSFDIIQSRAVLSSALKASSSSGWSFMGFPRQPSGLPSSTPLMWGASTLKLDLISHLLELGALADKRDNLGRNALHYAASPFQDVDLSVASKCIQRLIQGGTDTCGRDQQGKTPLMLAVSHGHPALDPRIYWGQGSNLHSKCIEAFLDDGASVNDADDMGWTALMHAISFTNCQPDTVELLCKGGASLEERNSSGFTALHLSLVNNVPENVVSVLLHHGADPNSETDLRDRQYGLDSMRPLDIALWRQASEGIIRLLLSHGADPDLMNGENTTPRAVARGSRRKGIIDLFATVSAERKRLPNPPAR